MQALDQIIIELKQLIETTIPQLSINIEHHKRDITENYNTVQSLYSVTMPVDNPQYAFHYLTFVKTIFEARDTISDVLRISTNISTLAANMLEIKTDNDQLKKQIEQQIEICDEVTEEIDKFTDDVTKFMRKFGAICATNDSFKSNLKFMLGQDKDADFKTWCDFWMDIPKDTAEYYDSPLEAVIGLITPQPLQPKVVCVSV